MTPRNTRISFRAPNADVRADMAQSLSDIGPAARGALGSLTEALPDTESEVRVWGALALWKIDRQIDTVAPVVVDAYVRRLPPDAPITRKFSGARTAETGHPAWASTS